MGFIRNIKNVFASRSFIKRSMRETKEAILGGSDSAKEMLDESVSACITTILQETQKMIRVQSAVNTFLQKYYDKKDFGDYSSHYVSYYYESICDCANLGDYIQTIATEGAIKKVVKGPVKFEYVRRNSLIDHSGGTCVMQGWYEHQQLTFLPGPDTRPVWIGTHFHTGTREMIKGLYQNSSIRLSDIGCRDRATMEFCYSMGITAYFSRCLTLTFPLRDEKEAQGADLVYLVDCSDEIVESLPAALKGNAKRISQRCYKFANWKNWQQCRAISENLLLEYKKNAKLIVTTALHCAQPCLAMGIPVIFIEIPDNEEERLSSMDGLLKLYTIDDLKNGKVCFDVKPSCFEDLKSAILRNLELSMKEDITAKEEQERMKIRAFIEHYSIFN